MRAESPQCEPRRSVRAWVGLGGNVGAPGRTLRRASGWLDAAPGARLEACSSLHRTAPMGPPQPTFVNAAARVRTTLPPMALLRLLQRMEAAAGRRRERRWGPRTLDLDLLHYEGVRLRRPELVLPHPGLAERPFVLAPLAEIDPQLVPSADGRTVRELLERSDGGSR